MNENVFFHENAFIAEENWTDLIWFKPFVFIPSTCIARAANESHKLFAGGAWFKVRNVVISSVSGVPWPRTWFSFITLKSSFVLLFPPSPLSNAPPWKFFWLTSPRFRHFNYSLELDIVRVCRWRKNIATHSSNAFTISQSSRQFVFIPSPTQLVSIRFCSKPSSLRLLVLLRWHYHFAQCTLCSSINC